MTVDKVVIVFVVWANSERFYLWEDTAQIGLGGGASSGSRIKMEAYVVKIVDECGRNISLSYDA